MKWFSDLKIKFKLIICFVIVAMCTSIVGYIGISNMKKINANVDKMYNNNFIPAQNLSKVQKNLMISRANYTLMLYSRDAAKIDAVVKESSNLATENDKILKDYENAISNEKDKELYNAVKDALASYRTVKNAQFALIQAGKYNEAEQKDADFTKAREKVDQSVSDLIDYNQQLAQTLAQNNHSDYSSKSTVMIVIIIICLIAAVIIGVIIATIISKPLDKLLKAADKIAQGELDVEIDIHNKDEVGKLADAFKNMVNTTNDVMLNISSAAEQVASGSRQVSSSSISLSEGATEQASSVEELTVSLEEISAQTKQNAENASEANELAEEVTQNAVHGNERMQEMLHAMNEINESSSNISKIIKVIDEIAFQTNILALNAAVEAARAGQHGKGFAVVAEEVRNLAARSAKAAKETTDMIEGSIKSVENGTKIANDTAESLNNIVEGVAKVSGIVNNIASASNEQAVGISQINQGIMQVSNVVQANSTSAEESAAASEELSSQAELLRDQVSRFKLKQNSSYIYDGSERLDPSILRMLEKMEDKKNKKNLHNNLNQSSVSRVNIDLSDNDFGKY